MEKFIRQGMDIYNNILLSLNNKLILDKAKKEAKHIFLYLILSAVGGFVDCCVFLILNGLGLPIIPSNIISGICGMVTSFYLNLKKNFEKNDHVKLRFISYITISLIGTMLSTSMIYFFIEVLNIPTAVSKFLQIIIMSTPLYLANRSITFREFGNKKDCQENGNYKNIKSPSEEVYQEAKVLLESGQLVVFPTETIYGLGADARNDEAVKNIFKLKGRPQDNPLIVHLGSKSQISDYATIENEIQQTIIDRLMPGPLTLLLKKKQNKISDFACPLEYVGIRLPSNSVAQKFLQTANLPVAAPSANISGKPSPTNAKMVYDNLHDNVPLIIDDGESYAGIESTVMRVVPDRKIGKGKFKIQILRPGFLTKEDLEDCFNNKIRVEYTTKNPELSPGMRYKHYSISGHVRIFDKLSDIPKLSKEFKSNDKKIGILLTQELINRSPKTIEKYINQGITIIPRGTKCNLASCAHSLFDHYHTAEKSGINLLFVERLPEEGIGYGIMNRVKRSAEV